MREIKFRQWNSLKKRFQFDIGMTDPGSWTGPAYCAWESYPLEQYTGLKDKNGREIYEGDIASPWGRPAIMKYFPYHARFMWARMVNGETEFVYDPEPRHEILGNIHENPELLGATESHADNR